MKMTLRSLVTCALATAAFAVPATANAEQPTKGGCPPGTWVLNGPAEWLQATRDGVAAEGSTMEEQAALFEFENVADFEAWIIDGVFSDAVGIDAKRR